MAWDKDKPAGSQKVRLSDDDIRENNDCLEDALSRDHEFPGTKSSTAGMHNTIQLRDPGSDPAAHATAVKIVNRAGVVKTIAPGGALKTIAHLTDVQGVLNAPAGTVMIFGQNFAPTGWTRKADWTDNAMLCYAASGNVATGGAVNPQGAHTHTGPSHEHTGPSHEHSGPSHDHDQAYGAGVAGSGAYAVGMENSPTGGLVAYGPGSANTYYPATGKTLAAGTGNTGASGTGNTGSAGTGATGANSAPFFQEVIACSKD